MMTVAFAAEVSLHLLRQEELKDDCCGSETKSALTALSTDWEGLETSKEYAVYMPRNDSGVSQIQEEWWRPRGVTNRTAKNCLQPCCHRHVWLHFSGYGTSEEGHAKRTGRRGHLMQLKRQLKEFRFGRFWRFDAFRFVDGFWMFGMVSLRGFWNFVAPRSSSVWFCSHWNIFWVSRPRRIPVALTNDFSRVKIYQPTVRYGLVKRNTYSSKTICSHA